MENTRDLDEMEYSDLQEKQDAALVRVTKEGKITQTSEVLQSNQLIEAAYRLPAAEHIALRVLFSQAEEGKLVYRIHRREIAKYLDMDPDTSYAHIAQTVKNLKNYDLVFFDDRPDEDFFAPEVLANLRQLEHFKNYELDKSEAGGYVHTSWVLQVKFIPHTGIIQYMFSPEVLKHLLKDLNKGNFTAYPTKHIFRFKREYTYRIYELMKQHMPIPKWHSDNPVIMEELGGSYKLRRVDVDRLRHMLVLGGKHSRVTSLKHQVLKPSIDEINNLSDIRCCVEPERDGKAIRWFVFYFRPTDLDRFPEGEVIETQAQKRPAEKGQSNLLEPKPQAPSQRDLPSEQEFMEMVERIPTPNKTAEVFEKLMELAEEFGFKRLKANLDYTVDKANKGKVDNFAAYLAKSCQADYASSAKGKTDPAAQALEIFQEKMKALGGHNRTPSPSSPQPEPTLPEKPAEQVVKIRPLPKNAQHLGPWLTHHQITGETRDNLMDVLLEIGPSAMETFERQVVQPVQEGIENGAVTNQDTLCSLLQDNLLEFLAKITKD